MRKTILIAVPASLLTACVGGDADIQYLSTFDGRTNGLVLHESGEEGHAGMFGTNCPFSTETGDVTGDYDLPDSDEDVQDGEPTEMGDVTLAAVIPGTVHVLDKTDGIYDHISLPLDGVVEGRLTWDGVVGMSQDCELTWMGLDGTPTASTQLTHCGGELETDPATGLTVVADAAVTVLTDGQTDTRLETTGDLVAFDDVAQAFYVATLGDSTLTAIELDGTVRWSVDVAGPITALDDAGSVGAAAVIVDQDEGGAVAFHDGRTGQQTRFAVTPSVAEDLAVSGNGQTIALVRPEQSFFYQLF